MKLLFTLAAFVLALGVLIVIHEFGHYIVARWCGVKVLRFSVGFGKPLWKRVLGRDQTEWVIAAFPLGGYVKMLDEREAEGAIPSADLPRAFNRQSLPRRFAIVSAGPIANFLLAIALYWFLFMGGVSGMKPIVGNVAPATPAAVAGFERGEEMLSINAEPIPAWQDARWKLLKLAVEKSPAVRIETRNAQGHLNSRILDLSGMNSDDLEGDFLKKIGLSVYQPTILPVIGEVVAGGAAERAGFRAGDEILAISDKPIARWEDLVQVIRASAGKIVSVEILREQRNLHFSVTPDETADKNEKIGKIGIAPKIDRAALEKLTVTVNYAPAAAMTHALEKTWEMSVFSLKMLWKMVMGEVSLKNISGPITIADYAGQSAQMGWLPYLNFIALISVSLGVLNLLPIPLLDGGHLMYYMVEAVKGSPLSERVMEIGQQLGMGLLFTLMAFAIYNDIHRLLG